MVWVKWLDACGENPGFKRAEEFNRNMTIESCGFLLLDDDKGVLMVQDFYEDNSGFWYRSSCAIPKEYILEKKVL